jgi:UDP-N-acetylbacillosamine transaminase
MQKLFENSKSILNGVSEELFSKGLCLASSTTMTKDDVKMICDLIKKEIEC